MLTRRLTLLLAVSLVGVAFAQDAPKTVSTPANLLVNVPARNLGPTTMGGRVVGVAVVESDPRIFYVASAAGGVWKTTNGGLTLDPVFTTPTQPGMGAVAVSQSNPNVVWAGTGESTSRNSISWGSGVYKSEDAGKTWASMGLVDTQIISRVLIHPKDPNIVYVGALGGLWSYNEERGVYKTTDGGKTWQKILYVDDKTGVSDMTMDPKNPNHIIVGMWQRIRMPWDLVSGGPGSAMFSTTDGGKNWNKVTKGMPEGELGKFGFSWCRSNNKVVIAQIEAKAGGVFRSEDGGNSWTKVNAINSRPFYYSRPEVDPNDPNKVYVLDASFRVSTDGGKTFTNKRLSVHVDHHVLWINPSDSNNMIVGNDGGVHLTRDGGETWQMLNSAPIGQFYAVTYDMQKPYWVYGGLQDNGSWGGPSQSHNGFVAFWDFNNVGGGDGFFVQVDPTDWTTVYSESQGGAITRIDQLRGNGRSIRPNPNNVRPRPESGERFRFNWSTPFLISPHNPRTLYIGGNRVFKSVNRGDNWEMISPDLTTNDPEKQKVGQKSLSPEDTGAERHCTIVALAESPFRKGLLYAGTDDGNLWISLNDGVEWSNVISNVPDLPANTWVSRVTPSKYMEGRAYALFDGHRTGDFTPYVYVTEDFGKTWTKLSNGLVKGDCTYVIREGEINPNLLFLGTERGLYASIDRGQTWAQHPGLPCVPVHDCVIHPRDLDLIIGTHGRSIWIMSVAGLEALTQPALQGQDVVLAKPQTILNFGRVDRLNGIGDGIYEGNNSQPGTRIFYYLKSDMQGDAKIKITDIEGNEVASLTGPVKAGLNGVNYNGRASGGGGGGRGGGRFGATLPVGEYRVTLTVGGKDYISSFTVESTVGDS